MCVFKTAILLREEEANFNISVFQRKTKQPQQKVRGFEGNTFQKIMIIFKQRNHHVVGVVVVIAE
jgi:hypothetical protein